MSEIELILTKLKIVSEEKENGMYLCDRKHSKILLDYIQQKENIIKEVREYIEKDTRWFDSEYAKTYGELCTCAGANDTRLEVLVNPSNILEILDKVEERGRYVKNSMFYKRDI